MSVSRQAGAISSCRHKSRKAEHRWPADRNADAKTSSTTCSINAVEFDNHRIDPAGFGDERRNRASSLGKRPIDLLRNFDGASKNDAGRQRISNERGANGAIARRELQHILRNVGFAQELDRHGGDERRLLGGLGDDAVSRHQRRCDLANENRERKIPGRNANKNAASMTTKDVGFARRPRQRHVGAENSRLTGVVAAKISRLAHLGERIVESLCRPRFATRRSTGRAAPQ